MSNTLDINKLNSTISNALDTLAGKSNRFESEAAELSALHKEMNAISNQIKGVQEYLLKTYFYAVIKPNDGCTLGYNFNTKKIFYSDEIHNKRNLMECSIEIRREMIAHIPDLLLKLKEFREC